MKEKDVYVVLIKADNEYYLLAMDHNDGVCIHGFKNENEAIEYFEVAYNEAHRSYTKSISACLHWMIYSPSIIKVKDTEYLKTYIIAEKPKCLELRHVSGYLKVITTRKGVSEYWEKGIKPRLIKE